MKIYIILAACGAILAGVIALALWAYDAGKQAERAAMAEKIAEYQKSQRVLIEKLEEANAKERIIYRTKVKTVRVAADPTGCLDTPIVNDVLEQLR